jgi:hypothetical protein
MNAKYILTAIFYGALSKPLVVVREYNTAGEAEYAAKLFCSNYYTIEEV